MSVRTPLILAVLALELCAGSALNIDPKAVNASDDANHANGRMIKHYVRKHPAKALHLIRTYCGDQQECMDGYHTALLVLLGKQEWLCNVGKGLNETIDFLELLGWVATKAETRNQAYLHSLEPPKECVDPLNEVLIKGTDYCGWHMIHMLTGLSACAVPIVSTVGTMIHVAYEGHENSDYVGIQSLDDCPHAVTFKDIMHPAGADLLYRDIGCNQYKGTCS